MPIDPYSNGYTVIPRALSLAMNRYFSPATRCVYRALYDIANYKEELKTHYVIDRGQTDISTRKLAEAAGVSHKAVRYAVELLKDFNLITTEKVGRGTQKILITICNYSEFDDLKNYRGTAGAQFEPVLGHSLDLEKSNNNSDLEEEPKNRGTVLPDFGAHNNNTVIKHNKDASFEDWIEILKLKQLELNAKAQKNAG